MEISDFGHTDTTPKQTYAVRVLPPPRVIKLKKLWHEYSLINKGYTTPIDFGIETLDLEKYKSYVYKADTLRLDTSLKEESRDDLQENMQYSKFSLTAEIAKYLNISCILVSRILNEAKDGTDKILDVVNKYNAVLNDVIIPKIFHTLYEVKCTQKAEDVDVVLLHEPKDKGYYEFRAKEELVICKENNNFTPKEVAKSFHADTYCFDSKPEKECFIQYIASPKVKEIYFTGMFTSHQGDLSVQYYDADSKRIRNYYPDFLAKMDDGSYEIIEVKGDNKIDDAVVKAKKEAAEEMALASGIKYKMYAGSVLMKSNVLDDTVINPTENINLD
jgi:hypothetical protein